MRTKLTIASLLLAAGLALPGLSQAGVGVDINIGPPAPIVEAVAFHHTPEKSTHQVFSPLTAVHVANALVHEAEADGEPSSLNHDYLDQIGVTDRLDAWREKAEELSANAAETEPELL